MQIKKLQGGQRKYTLNQDYFDSVNTQEKAYFLGFMYSDGYNNENQNSLSISLQKRDKEILEKFNSMFDSNRPIRTEERSKKNKKHQDICYFNITSKKISQQFKKLGCPQKKTFILRFPNKTIIPENFIHHFIRGYFDGDGCLSFYKQDKDYTVGRVYILSTKSFCLSLGRLLKKKLGINFYIQTRNIEKYKNPKFPCRVLQIGGNRQAKIFLDWIYRDSKLHLTRKYDKYLEFLKIVGEQSSNFSKRRGFKLTYPLAEKIRGLFKTGLYKKAHLARKFNIGQDLMGLVIKRKIWKKENRLQTYEGAEA